VGKSPVLRITLEESGTRCRIIAAVGETVRDTDVEMLPDSYRDGLLSLQEAILRSPGSRRTAAHVAHRAAADNLQPGLVAGAHEKMVQEIGSQLFDFVFQRKVLELYQQTLAGTSEEEPLLIKFCVKHPKLSYLPWEALYDRATRSHITTSAVTPFQRCISGDEDNIELPPGRPIRILGMAARVKTINGITVDAIDVDREQIAIKDAIADLESRGQVKLSWVPSAKTRDLRRMVARGDNGARWDIFHFIGHGGFDEDRGMGYIVVQEPGGSKGAKLYADDLRDILLQPGRRPKLVILNSCSGAEGKPGELFSSTAAELIQARIPAVVAMQFEISDNMGIAFSNSFYTYLADGAPIDRALANTRGELKSDSFGEWISPVLYMRTNNGGLFEAPADQISPGAAVHG
jgi:hypothetical protein